MRFAFARSPDSSLQPDSKNTNAGTERVAEVAADIGLDDCVVVPTDGRKLVVVQRTDVDLDSPAARTLAIADNRTSEVGLSWDG